MNNYTADQVLNGTWGEMWLNGDLMAETTALQAKVTLTKTAVEMCGTLSGGSESHGNGTQRNAQNEQSEFGDD